MYSGLMQKKRDQKKTPNSNIFHTVPFCLVTNELLIVVWLLIFFRSFISWDTAQKMKIFAIDFFSKCDQIRSFLRIGQIH